MGKGHRERKRVWEACERASVRKKKVEEANDRAKGKGITKGKERDT